MTELLREEVIRTQTYTEVKPGKVTVKRLPSTSPRETLEGTNALNLDPGHLVTRTVRKYILFVEAMESVVF